LTCRNAPAGPLSQTARRVDSQELQHVRSVVKKRGGDGINGLSRIFRQFDDNGNHKLDKAEFITGLQNYGVRLSKEQFNSLFKQFDRNGDTVVSVTEFLRTVAGPLNRKRREIVDRAFDKFDRDDSGAVTIDDLVGLYKTDGNPDVQSGRKTAQQVLTDFLNSFQAGADGHITTEDFAEYYANISCGIDSDEAFELLLTRSWDTSTNAKLDSYKGGV
jgi:Ca2+-binding EF-hand superfamily protein